VSGETTTTLSNYIFTDYSDEVRKTHYQGTPLLNFFGVRPQEKPGESMDWIVESAGYTAYNYTQGATPPSPQSQTSVALTLGFKYCWIVAKVDGAAVDALRNGFLDPVSKAMDDAVSAVNYKCETNMVASFIAAIDDDTTYGGANRAAYNLASAVVDGGSAALTAAKLDSLREKVKLRPKDNDAGDLVYISAPEQLTAYAEISGTAYNEKNFIYSSEEGVYDISRIKPSMRYAGAPWFEIPTMTNTYVFLTRKSDVVIEEHRPITFKMLGAVDDSDMILVSRSMEMKHYDPYRAGRIELLST